MQCRFEGDLAAIKAHYKDEHHADGGNRYLAAYLVSLVMKKPNKRQTCSVCGKKNTMVRRHTAHMVKEHLMMGGGITDERSVFTVTRMQVEDLDLVNFVYERTKRI